MKFFQQIPSWLKNKYLVSFLAFAAWMLFFDERDIFTQIKHNQELKALQASKRYFAEEIDKLNRIKLEITTNPNLIEKIARENYYMKRDEEDLFIVPDAPEK